MESGASKLYSHSGMTVTLHEGPALEVVSRTSEPSYPTFNGSFDAWKVVPHLNLYGGFDASLTSATTPDGGASLLAPVKPQQRRQQRSYRLVTPPSCNEETLSDTDTEVHWHRPPLQSVLTPPAVSKIEPTTPKTKATHSSNGGSTDVEEKNKKEEYRD
ncbi:hypothetical protein, unknown function [Leishmania braziliensis MHOM/BR/75/M2904]|uniref:Uncharacterized protein n=2 Tax=Leishmania braziliensis TaxID=5660 RepID=A4HJ49_LEIBR|nr:hypothetical protein, unknown function [Leishmania braziliensis MHOM/BR/75/M2904]CAJ2477754.1 unnamed protein product [Leishmania braziliensis]CAM42508.1 hypothetical protein, unknown function [Leishmania braziliensis MHOM/BR/75/M2904]SYZ68269.1 hypothetical_protein [Leishmania braziliensis MHOM/BR/75/M2904]